MIRAVNAGNTKMLINLDAVRNRTLAFVGALVFATLMVGSATPIFPIA